MGRSRRARRSSTTPTRSSASTPSPSAAPTCTSSKGDVPEVTDGRILGHEAVGTVESVGAGVKNVKPGDRVLVSCITACGACRFCREGRYGQCLGGGGWILGHLIDGTQAEYVRVPFADTSTYPVPAGRHRRGGADGRRHPARPATRSASSTAMSRRATSSRSSARVRSACRRSWAPGSTARATSSRSTWPTAGSKRRSSSVPTSSSTRTRGRAGDRARAHRAGSVPTSRSKRSVRPRRSSSPCPWPGRVATSPTSACTASRRRCISRSCGSGTSPSRPVSSTRSRHRRSCVCWRVTSSTRRTFVTHHFALDEFMEAYDVFAARRRDRRAQGRADPAMNADRALASDRRSRRMEGVR